MLLCCIWRSALNIHRILQSKASKQAQSRARATQTTQSICTLKYTIEPKGRIHGNRLTELYIVCHHHSKKRFKSINALLFIVSGLATTFMYHFGLAFLCICRGLYVGSSILWCLEILGTHRLLKCFAKKKKKKIMEDFRVALYF